MKLSIEDEFVPPRGNKWISARYNPEVAEI
jgi:hypothetical protein